MNSKKIILLIIAFNLVFLSSFSYFVYEKNSHPPELSAVNQLQLEEQKQIIDDINSFLMWYEVNYKLEKKTLDDTFITNFNLLYTKIKKPTNSSKTESKE